jgi:hypothetical protein
LTALRLTEALAVKLVQKLLQLSINIRPLHHSLVMPAQSSAPPEVNAAATLLVLAAQHEREEKRTKRTAAVATHPTMQKYHLVLDQSIQTKLCHRLHALMPRSSVESTFMFQIEPTPVAMVLCPRVIDVRTVYDAVCIESGPLQGIVASSDINRWLPLAVAAPNQKWHKARVGSPGTPEPSNSRATTATNERANA